VSVQTTAFQEVVDVLRRNGWRTNVWDVSTNVQLRDALEANPTSITGDLGVVDPPDPA
jgi:hypothetical protein